MKKYLIFLCIFSVAACSTGRKIDVNMVKKEIQINQSTAEDVLRICGEPQSRRSGASKQSEIWHYAYLKKNVTGFGVFTHVVGIGTETRSKRCILDIMFEEDVVVDYKINQGSMKSMHFK